MAEVEVGGGASCALARVLRVVGESVSKRCKEGRREGGSEGAGEVCSDNFGRLWFEAGEDNDDVGGITESMVSATFLRSSAV